MSVAYPGRDDGLAGAFFFGGAFFFAVGFLAGAFAVVLFEGATAAGFGAGGATRGVPSPRPYNIR